MNHNKYNLMVGQIVILDANYQNKSEVGIHAFTPNEMYATVYAKNDTGRDMWQVMTNRLSPIEIISGNGACSHAGNYGEERS
jgi:hypothetical protein